MVNIISRTVLTEVFIVVESIKMYQAKNLKVGDIVYAIGYYNSDGTAQRFKVQGNPKTWKRNTERVKVTLKRGLKEFVTLTELCLEEFSLTEPEPLPKVKGGKLVQS